jgi:hypothetical protein
LIATVVVIAVVGVAIVVIAIVVIAIRTGRRRADRGSGCRRTKRIIASGLTTSVTIAGTTRDPTAVVTGTARDRMAWTCATRRRIAASAAMDASGMNGTATETSPMKPASATAEATATTTRKRVIGNQAYRRA